MFCWHSYSNALENFAMPPNGSNAEFFFKLQKTPRQCLTLARTPKIATIDFNFRAREEMTSLLFRSSQVLFSDLQKNYLRELIAKLLSVKGLKNFIKNPSIANKHARSLFFNRNFRNVPQEQNLLMYKDLITALARLSILSIDRIDISFEEWLPLVTDDRAASDLALLFNKHGSDKSTYHDYHHIYNSILIGRRERPLNILEIGLGSNNLDVPSNMGPWGRPGASLRAFRDWLPHAHIFGADVDKRILFQEERISTFWVDQTDEKSLFRLASQLSRTKFDLIIDDGLHLPHANFNTLDALLTLLGERGVFVVEDIEPVHKPFWQLARAVLAAKYDTYFTAAKGGCVFVARASNLTVASQPPRHLEFRAPG